MSRSEEPGPIEGKPTMRHGTVKFPRTTRAMLMSPYPGAKRKDGEVEEAGGYQGCCGTAAQRVERDWCS
jgi:hypothetical protein